VQAGLIAGKSTAGQLAQPGKKTPPKACIAGQKMIDRPNDYQCNASQSFHCLALIYGESQFFQPLPLRRDWKKMLF